MLINQLTVAAIICDYYLLIMFLILCVASQTQTDQLKCVLDDYVCIFICRTNTVLIFGDCSTNICSEKFMFVKIIMQIVTLHFPDRHLFLA